MIEGQVPQDHVLLTIPGVGRLAAGIIIGIVGDVKRFPKPESFVAYCGLDPVVERSGRAVVSRGISKRGNKYLRSLFYFLAVRNYSRRFLARILISSSTKGVYSSWYSSSCVKSPFASFSGATSYSCGSKR